MENFTPVSALIGGAAIGIATAVLLFAKRTRCGHQRHFGRAGFFAARRYRMARAVPRRPDRRRAGTPGELRLVGGDHVRCVVAATGLGRLAGWLWHPAWRRLHQRPRGLRHGTAFGAFDRGGGNLYAGGRRGAFYCLSRGGRLSHGEAAQRNCCRPRLWIWPRSFVDGRSGHGIGVS